MRNVKCHDCGKRYNFDIDDFCPKCGAFTQPARASRIGMDGTVIRQDGINEQNHKNSFVHRELHAESRKRKGSVLEGISTAARHRVGKNVPRTSLKRGMTTGIALGALGEALDFVCDIFDA